MTEILKRITKSDIRNVLAVLVVAGFIVTCYALLIRIIPPDNLSTVNIIIGNFSTLSGMVISYYFGSSKAENDQKKADIANNDVSNIDKLV